MHQTPLPHTAPRVGQREEWCFLSAVRDLARRAQEWGGGGPWQPQLPLKLQQAWGRTGQSSCSVQGNHAGDVIARALDSSSASPASEAALRGDHRSAGFGNGGRDRPMRSKWALAHSVS